MGSFEQAISRFDAFNSSDPNHEDVDGSKVPRELVYAQRMSECLGTFAPHASEEVRLAARCQHIGRWRIPRNTYPDGRKGYLQWRSKLKELHADTAEEMLRDSGYDSNMIDRVRLLLLKKDMLHNPDTQLLEDVVCLVFIKYYLTDFADKHDPKKVVDILKKTLKKMSPAAKAAASTIHLDVATAALVKEAISEQPPIT